MALEKIRPRIVDETGNYTFNNVTATGNLLTLNANLGNIATANYVKTNNLQYANGVSWPIGGAVTASGSNTHVQFNNAGSLGSSANFVFDSSTNRLTVDNITANGAALTNLTGANITGNVANANFAAYAGNITVAAQSNITSVGTLTSLDVSGNISTGNANLGNFVIANFFSGSGNNLSNIQSSNITGAIAYATVANSVAGANVSGAVTYAATANAVAGANVLGAVANATYADNAGTAYSVSASNISGTINLANFATTANAVAGANVSGNVGNALNAYAVAGANVSGAVTYATTANSVAGANVSGAVTYAATANAVAGANVSGFVANANVANTAFAVAGANVSGAVSYATTANAVAGANVSGFVANANVAHTALTVAGANVSGQVANALVASTVYTNAQPNITSVGTLSSLDVTGNISAGNANLGNNVTANFFTGSGAYLTSVTAVTAGTVTTNAQPNITSVGTLSNLIIGNATANSTFGNGTITATGNISFTGANVSLGSVSNLKITGGTAGYFLSTDGAGNLSWGAAAGGGGVSATGSNTQLQFNDGGVLGASANLVFDKTTNTFSTGRVVASAGANLGSNISNIYVGGGGSTQILSTDGSGNLTWIAQPTAVITVDNFTGNGVQTAFTLTTTPSSINQTVVNYNGAFQLRSAYTVVGPTITFSEAPANGSLIEITTTQGATSGSGAFVTRTYTGNGVATTFTVTSGSTVSSVLVTENGLLQVPTTDYTVAGSTLTFNTAPANGVIVQIRELAIALATTNSPVYRAYTGNGVANTFTITSGLTANSLIIAENGIIQRPITDYSVSGSNVIFINAPSNGVDVQIRELSLNGGMSSGGISLPTQTSNSGKYLTTDGATASWANVGGSALTIKEEGSNLTTTATSIDFVGAGVTATNTGNAVTVTVPTGTTRAQAMTMGIIFGG